MTLKVEKAEITHRQDEPYFVEVGETGCSDCGAGRTYTVVGPDGVAIGQSWEEEDEAAEMASRLNEAFYIGIHKIDDTEAERDQKARQVEELGQALGSALIKAGVIAGDRPLTGPQLLSAAETYCRNPTRQKKVMSWALENFGPVAANRDERAARLLEEAIEIAQIQGLSISLIQRIAEHVYSRPPGRLGQEIGGVAITLDALAENTGFSVEEEAGRELARILALPKEWWKRKHAVKVAAGVADLSATGKEPDGN